MGDFERIRPGELRERGETTGDAIARHLRQAASSSRYGLRYDLADALDAVAQLIEQHEEDEHYARFERMEYDDG